MTDGQDDFVTIRPRRSVLSDAAKPVVDEHVSEPVDAPQKKAVPRNVAIGLFSAGVVALGAWVFIVLPMTVKPPPIDTAAIQQAAAVPKQTQEAIEQAPFHSVQHELEGQKAKALLQRFVQLQIKLDDEMSVEKWAADDFAAAQHVANQGDERFNSQRFDEAMALYQQGIDALDALVARGEDRFNSSLATSLTSIARGDTRGASSALDDAATIHPKDPHVAATRARIDRIPQVARARARGDDAVNRGDWAAAAAAYQEASTLDPGLTDLAPLIANARKHADDAAFDALLSQGYGAIDEGHLDVAKDVFTKALARRPGDRAASDGLAQVSQAGTLTRIERLQAMATRDEASEKWREAAAAYTELLTVDPTLKVAVDGAARAKTRADLDDRLEAALADAGKLSADGVYKSTVALYQEAVRVQQPGARLTSQLDRLESMLTIASAPVPVVLTSDNATQISLFQVGPIGAFSRKELSLRPGRYLVTGSRQGCRDIRVEIDVRPAMEPVDVRCLEKL